MDTINQKTKTGMLVSLVLSVIGIGFILFNLVSLIPAGEAEPIAHNLIFLAMHIMSLYYVLVGYKKPHGNLLRGLFFAFGLCIIVQNEIGTHYDEASRFISNIASAIAALEIAYVAGRLNKIEKNRDLLVTAGLLLAIQFFVFVMMEDFMIGKTVARCTPLIVLASLGYAYTARFEAHKAAGLE